MAFLDSFLKYNPVSAVPYFIGDQLDITGANSRRSLDEYQGNAANARNASKAKQYELLGQMRGPVTTPQMEARIKALEEESKAGPLSTDPYFQGARTQVARGGAAELAAVNNQHTGRDVEGGFSNTGSIQDVYDRLGGQLANLGQQQTVMKSQKRDAASELRQGISDAQIAHDNALTQASMAIESGDSTAAQDAMARAYAAKEQIKNNSRQLMLGIGSLGIQAMTGGQAKGVSAPMENPAGGGGYASQNYWQNQVNSPLSPNQGATYMTWNQMKK